MGCSISKLKKMALDTDKKLSNADHAVQKECHGMSEGDAAALMSTSLLQALPSILPSGFLFEDDCWSAAATCKSWHRVWNEVEDQLPAYCRMKLYSKSFGAGSVLPDSVLHVRFAQTVFCHVKARFPRESLPGWGSFDNNAIVASCYKRREGPLLHLYFGNQQDLIHFNSHTLPRLKSRSTQLYCCLRTGQESGQMVLREIQIKGRTLPLTAHDLETIDY